MPIHDVADTVDGNCFGDELPFASAVASFAGNVDLIEIRTADLTPIQAIRRSLQIHDEPKHAAGNAYWILDLLATASRDGVGTLLSGQGGNATISWTGMQFRQRMRRLMTERHWKAVVQRLIYPHIPIPMIRGMRHLLHDQHIDWSRTAICPEFASRIKLAQQYVEGTGTTTQPRGVARAHPSALCHHHARKVIRGLNLGGIQRRAPPGCARSRRSTNVLELVLAVPDREFAGPNGIGRWLIRSAMQGIMPDEVRLSPRRGRQAADLGLRLLHSAPEVEEALREIDASPLACEYVAADCIRTAWDGLQQEVNASTTHQAVTILTRGIMAGLFLKHFERVRM